jgi:subtilisin family serine protease
MRPVLAMLFVSLVAAAALAAGTSQAAKGPGAGSYIVVFKPGAVRAANEPRSQRPLVAVAARELARAHGGNITFVYQHALKGFAVTVAPDEASALAANPRVAYVEPDQVVHAFPSQSPATWGLDRIDQRDLPLNNTYNYNQTGQGVQAYIIDTGIRATHQQFAGRMGNGADFVGDGQGTNDCNGHGTHVAGTTGGTTYGVAKAVTLHAVRVLNCQGSGTNSGVIAGVDWVRANHGSPAVANMSLGGGISSALDTAVNNSINSGVSYAIAAGNSNANACNTSPARVAAANTVGATTSSDARSSFSNFGTCLDIFAPGSSITSAWNTSDTATNTISGTSMASPHVAGAIALYLQTNPGASPSTVTNALIANATLNHVTNPGTGSPNRLLYSLFGAPPPPPPPPPPAPPPPPPPAPPPPPPPSPELIVNGGFEGSSSPWSLSGNAYWSTGAYPHSGTGYSILGAYNYASGTEYQTVSIPSGQTANYTFWLNVTTSEACCTPYDYLYAEVRNTSGSLLSTLATYTNANSGPAGSYTQKSFSLANWRGQTVRVQFRATTDFSLPTSFRIDDVSLR